MIRPAYVVSNFVEIPADLTAIFAARRRPPQPDVLVKLAEDTWSVRGCVRPHVDGIGGERVGWSTLGLILYTNCTRYCLTCDTLELPLHAGTVYRLDPTVVHGVALCSGIVCTWTSNRGERGEDYEHNVLTFLAWDYPPGEEPALNAFAAQAMKTVCARWFIPESWRGNP